MEFSEKLEFLMSLTNTTNRQLGDLLGIHQSQISRMRRGARGMPGNGEYIRKMSEYFASGCSYAYQRSALAEALGRPPLKLPIESSVLAAILFSWLTGQSGDAVEKATLLLSNYSALDLSTSRETPDENNGRGGESEIIAYYGDEGKRAAVSAFIQYLYSLEEPQSVDFTSDESIGWLIDDPVYSERISSDLMKLCKMGFIGRYIARNITNLEGAYSSYWRRWLPLSYTGHLSMYYYPRLRDGTFHRTTAVVPGKAAVFSSSFGRSAKTKVTFFVKDGDVADALDGEFEDYLSMCHPLMNKTDTSREPEKVIKEINEFDALETPCIQRSTSLSTETLPISLVSSLRCQTNIGNTSLAEWFRQHTEQLELFLGEYPLTDIIALADVRDILAGRVKIQLPRFFGCKPEHYTLDTYLLHLKNIMRYIETFPNYHVIIGDGNGFDMNFIRSKDAQRVVFTRKEAPTALYKINEYHLASAFNEMVHRSVSNDKPDSSDRRRYAQRIKELIDSLEEIKKNR